MKTLTAMIFHLPSLKQRRSMLPYEGSADMLAMTNLWLPEVIPESIIQKSMLYVLKHLAHCFTNNAKQALGTAKKPFTSKDKGILDPVHGTLSFCVLVLPKQRIHLSPVQTKDNLPKNYLLPVFSTHKLFIVP